MGVRDPDPAFRLLRRIERALCQSSASGEEVLVVGEMAGNRRDKIFEAKGELRNSSRPGAGLARPENTCPSRGPDVAGECSQILCGDAGLFFRPAGLRLPCEAFAAFTSI